MEYSSNDINDGMNRKDYDKDNGDTNFDDEKNSSNMDNKNSDSF